MTPKCCENCEHLGADGGCKDKGKECYKWRAWFREEWSRIRRAVEFIKKSKKEDPPE